MLSNFNYILERALRIEEDVQRTKSRRENRKRPRCGETTNLEPKKIKDNVEQEKATPYNYCGKLHGGVCYKKIGACYTCRKIGHQFFEYPNKKDSIGPSKTPDQERKRKARVFSLTTQDFQE